MPKGILNKASLVMVPEAPIDGTMPSVFPENRSGDFTFTRGSNLSATRVASNGLIEKGRENLFLRSNEFNLTWNTYNASRTSGAADFDGGNNAWTLAKTGSYGLINQYIANTGVHTFSIYVKAGSLDWVALTTSQAPYSAAYFDLANGVVGSLVNAIDSNIESVGGGWYRCSLTSNVAAAGNWRIYPADSDGGLSNANLGDIVIYKSQLEAGLIATSYIESGATTGTAGLLENEPRIDFTGGGCGALLLEPQRSNLIKYSEYINPSVISWSKFFDTIITNNDAVSPDGTKNATKIACPSVGSARIDAVVSSIAAGTYIYSCYAKGDVSNLYLNVYQDSSGTTLSSTQISTLINGSDWTRIDVTFTSTATSTIRFIYNTLPNGEHFYLWGAQVEAGSYPTSYIPTYGSSATRNADNPTLGNLQSNNIAGDTFSYFFEWGDYVADRNFEIRDSSNNLTLFMVNRLFRYYQDDGSVDTLLSLPTSGTSLKCMVTYDGTTLKGFVNGALEGSVTDAKASQFSDFNYLRLDRDNPDREELRSLMIFPTALTDEECSALTQP